ncbi:MAG: phenylalanine--tRNA ligase beta subunit-related protein [Candidatus Eisenbacteria bacterium]
MTGTPIAIENTLADRVRIAAFEVRGIEVVERTDELEAAMESEMETLRGRYPDPPSAAEWTEPARRLYRALGIDPSRRRPSSEALLRRILQGKGLYTVNTAVDAANLASLRIALPVGLYDRDAIAAEPAGVVLRLGRPGESYDGIRKDAIHVEDRPTLADAVGAFGNPSSDSARTRVGLGTKAILFVVYAPVDTTPELLHEHGAVASDTMVRFVGGACTQVRFG